MWKEVVLLTRVPAVGAARGGGGPSGSGAKSGLADRTMGNLGWGKGAVCGPVCVLVCVAGTAGARAAAEDSAARACSGVGAGFGEAGPRVGRRCEVHGVMTGDPGAGLAGLALGGGPCGNGAWAGAGLGLMAGACLGCCCCCCRCGTVAVGRGLLKMTVP